VILMSVRATHPIETGWKMAERRSSMKGTISQGGPRSRIQKPWINRNGCVARLSEEPRKLQRLLKSTAPRESPFVRAPTSQF
jgi:hypothetical protein